MKPQAAVVRNRTACCIERGTEAREPVGTEGVLERRERPHAVAMRSLDTRTIRELEPLRDVLEPRIGVVGDVLDVVRRPDPVLVVDLELTLESWRRALRRTTR